ncbi:MAG TPA: thiol reductase thioredoxin, partial [Acetobacteraceae bacterium]|nr:thiol reductase thioredoxin [Acetobacteraceae bacterium]
MQIVCPHCAVVNRVPSDKPAEKAKCGACKNAL